MKVLEQKEYFGIYFAAIQYDSIDSIAAYFKGKFNEVKECNPIELFLDGLGKVFKRVKEHLEEKYEDLTDNNTLFEFGYLDDILYSVLPEQGESLPVRQSIPGLINTKSGIEYAGNMEDFRIEQVPVPSYCKSCSYDDILKINIGLDKFKEQQLFDGQSTEKQNPKSDQLSLREIALLCHYTDQHVTPENQNNIAKEYSFNSGAKLQQHYNKYSLRINRIGAESSAVKTKNKIDSIEKVMDYLNKKQKEKAERELMILNSAYKSEFH